MLRMERYLSGLTYCYTTRGLTLGYIHTVYMSCLSQGHPCYLSKLRPFVGLRNWTMPNRQVTCGPRPNGLRILSTFFGLGRDRLYERR